MFGFVQGFLVAYMDIQPFIVTLAGIFLPEVATAIISKDMISITNETFMAWAKLRIYLPFERDIITKRCFDAAIYLSNSSNSDIAFNMQHLLC